MGDYGHALAAGQVTQQADGRRARVEENGIAVLYFSSGEHTNLVFISGIQVGAHRHGDSAGRADGGNAAIDLGDMAACFKVIEVAADGILGYTKDFAEFIDGNGLFRDNVLLDRVETTDFHIFSLFFLMSV